MDRSSMATLAATARRQHGVVTTRQADTVVGAPARRRMVARGQLEPVVPGVLRIAGAPATPQSRVLAACLAVDGRAVASYASALWLWGLDAGPHPLRLEVTIPTSAHTPQRRRPDVVVHQTTVWGAGHGTWVQAIPVTSMARTLCDLSAVRSHLEVRRAMDLALTKGLVSLDQLRTVAADLEGPGRRRSTLTSEAIEVLGPERAHCQSTRQILLLEAIVAAGLPTPVVEHEVTIDDATYRPDLSYPDIKVALEYDGWDGHANYEGFHGDRDRGNDIAGDGWTVLHYSSRASIRRLVRALSRLLARAA